jgi:ketosteroid isomerase-like protein
MRKPMRLPTGLACAVAVLVWAGCGQSDQEQVREVVQDYIQTVSKGDFAATCDLFTAEYRRQLGGDPACVQAQAAQFGSPSSKPELALSSVHVKGEHANAGLQISRDSGSPSPLSLLLVLEDDDQWRIRGQQ